MKTILITGANRGIGLELANQYSQLGWRVLACCRNPTTATGLVKNDHLHIYPLDVTQKKDIQNLADQLQDTPIDILVNNAGISGPDESQFHLIDPALWLETFQINAVAPFMIAQALTKQIGKSQLKIIANITSIYGSIGMNEDESNWVAYRSSKAGLNAATKCLANDLKGQGITVVAIHPGSVCTDMNPSGSITPTKCAEGIRKVLHSLSLKDTGAFLDYKNKRLHW